MRTKRIIFAAPVLLLIAMAAISLQASSYIDESTEKKITALEEDVADLEYFLAVRDTLFLGTKPGRIVYDFYYKHSPLITTAIEENNFALVSCQIGGIMIYCFLKYYVGGIVFLLFFLSIVIVTAYSLYSLMKKRPAIMLAFCILTLLGGVVLVILSFNNEDNDFAVRKEEKNITVLADNCSAENLDALLDIADKGSSSAKYYALYSLRKYEREVLRAREERITGFLADGDIRVRYWTMYALARVGSESAVDAVAVMLDDPSYHLRKISAEIIAIYKRPRHLELLETAVEKENYLYPLMYMHDAIVTAKKSDGTTDEHR